MSAPMTITAAMQALCFADACEAVPPTMERRCDCGKPCRRRDPLCRDCWEADCKARREAAIALKLPARHREARFESQALTKWCRDPRAIRLARAYADVVPECYTVTLWGETEAGKSTLAAAMAWRILMKRPVSFLWVDARDLALSRRESPFGGEPALLRRTKSVEFAVIDELGKETLAHGNNREDVVDVLAYRDRMQLRTILTTEWSADTNAKGLKLIDVYGPSVIRRLTEPWQKGPPTTGCAFVIEVKKV